MRKALRDVLYGGRNRLDIDRWGMGQLVMARVQAEQQALLQVSTGGHKQEAISIEQASSLSSAVIFRGPPAVMACPARGCPLEAVSHARQQDLSSLHFSAACTLQVDSHV